MPETTRCFEDFHVGDVVSLGSRTLTRDEIVAFAARWDPQPMHLDEAGGDASLLGSLAASGWHTIGLTTRIFVDGLLNHSASLGSPGVDSVKWLSPLRPGDVLAVRLTVRGTRTSASRPRVGLVAARFDVTGPQDRPVMRMDCTLMMERRPQ